MSTELLLFILTMVLVSACATSAPANPADRFVGTWSGTMSMIDDPTVSSVAIVTIPTGCSVNEPCGNATNSSNGCKWEMTLNSVDGDVFKYSFSKSLEGDCPVSGNGKLTLNAYGTLFREHTFPDFAIAGTLTRK